MAAGGGNRLPARPKTPVFREAQKHVQAILEKKWLTRFLETPEYKARKGVDTHKETWEEEGEERPKDRVYSLNVSFNCAILVHNSN